MTTGGFDPNLHKPEHGNAQPGAGRPFDPRSTTEPFVTQQFAQPDFGFDPAPPGELLPRLGARVIDGLIVGIPTAVVAAIISLALGNVGDVIGVFLTAAAAVGYFVYFETTKGQTPGKQLLKLRVVGASGGLPTQQESLIRNSFYILSALSGFAFIGYLFGLLGIIAAIVIGVTINSSPTKQGKHDELAGGTRVVQSS